MPRFLCDEMVARLARWLRAAGHDTLAAEPGEADAALVTRAAAEDRWLLSRDRRLSQRKAAAGRLVPLRGQGVEAWAEQLSERFALDWLAAPFSRCMVDNTPLEPHPLGLQAAPPSARGLPGEIRHCPACGRAYWPGSHTRRMREVLERWQNRRFAR